MSTWLVVKAGAEGVLSFSLPGDYLVPEPPSADGRGGLLLGSGRQGREDRWNSRSGGNGIKVDSSRWWAGIAICFGRFCASGGPFLWENQVVGWLFFRIFERRGRSCWPGGGSAASRMSTGYEVCYVDVVGTMVSLSKLAPAKVGLKEKSGFWDLENRGFQQTRHRQSNGTRRRNCQDCRGVAGKEGTSGQETRAVPSGQGHLQKMAGPAVHWGVEDSVGQCYTAAVFGSQVHRLTTLFLCLTAHGWWNRGCRRWGSLVPQEATGNHVLCWARYHQVFDRTQLVMSGNARYAAVLEWATA